ncbi:hypothetical protein CQW23_12073 [Capsicum baccatum]|uniref:Uncharacterized protein n=1 Tax=Capsicum baccatum TaxID=33114 RepID=A0A2G2WRI8_CAPBA|nr:hypothetical protein CQW23_12073 [Capsicum baccatum]
MASKEGNAIRRRAEEMGEAFRRSAEKEGSSRTELDSFIGLFYDGSTSRTVSSDAYTYWYGVICVDGWVNRSNITNANNIGTLFPFSSLPFLEYVDISMNQLSGTIPPEIGKLTSCPS